MANKKINVMKPTNKDTVSTRHLPQSADDRKQQLSDFKAGQAEKEKIKEDRFAAIKAKRKPRPGAGGSGGGINITVDSDKK
jgi:hypothetical protein